MKKFFPRIGTILTMLLPITGLLLLNACDPESGGDGGSITHTVTFDTNGGVPATIAPIQVADGESMDSQYPADPVMADESKVFGGWYDGGVFTSTNRYTRSKAVTKNLALTARWNAPVVVDPKEKRHIYIAFGQSNMVGHIPTGSSLPASYQQNIPENFEVMASANDANNPGGRTMGQWYPASPPLVRSGNGLSPADFFGRTIAEAVAEDGITVGVIAVAVNGTAINGFDKDETAARAYYAAQQQWMRNEVAAYNTYPYARLVEMAKIAQETGVIKGIIMHQGESGKASSSNLGTNGSDNANWATAVRQVYDNLLADLEIEAGSLPFLAGQAVGNNNGTIAGVTNAFSDLPGKAFLIPSDDCPPSGTSANDAIHFSFGGYEELGRRYGRKMLELVYGITE